MSQIAITFLASASLCLSITFSLLNDYGRKSVSRGWITINGENYGLVLNTDVETQQ